MGSDQARQQVGKSFKQDENSRGGRQALTVYEKRAIAILEETARLKALRLAMEAQARSSRDK